MRNMIVLVVMCIITGVISCNRSKRANEIFLKAQRVMAQHPDSALSLLLEFHYVKGLPAEDKAMYYLLVTEARNKSYIEIPSDSLITLATDYFDRTEKYDARAKAWYYRGRVNQDLGDALRAQDYYLKALRNEDQVADKILLGRIYSSLGMLCAQQRVYEDAIPYQKNALKYFHEMKDSIGQSFVLRDLGQIFNAQGNRDSAVFYYEKGLDFGNNVAKPSIYSELGGLYVTIGEYAKSYECVRKSLSSTDKRVSLFSTYLTLGKLYAHAVQEDSANYYLKKSLDSPNPSTKASSYYYLSKLEKEKENWKQCALYKEQFELLNDTVLKIKETESIRQMRNLYNYHRAEAKLAETMLAVVELENWRLTMGLVALLLIVAIVIFYYRLREKKMHIQDQKERLAALKRKQEEDRNRIEKNEKQISELESRLKESAVAFDEREKELMLLSKQRLEAEILKLKYAKAENELLVEQFQMSEIYFRFHLKEDWRPKADDWAELFAAIDEAYDGFTHRIMGITKKMTDTELKVCCLLKANVIPAMIATLVVTSPTNVSMIRRRLHEKIFPGQTSTEKFDKFIQDF